MSSASKLLHAGEVAERWQCSIHTVYRLIRAGVLRASRVRGTRGWLIAEEDALAAIEEFRPDAPQRTGREGTAAHEAAVEELRRRGIG